MWVAFEATQIKSATKNNGNFNPANPDIRFSQGLPTALAEAVNNAKEVALPAGYKVDDFFKSTGKLSWWHKSVGTQYNLAQRSPTFKRVFDNVQSFINDVSSYATQAADLAPTILPKLETLRDITKSPLTAADNKALAAPVFEGTLIWSRDEQGELVKSSVMEEKAKAMTTADKAQRLFREGKIAEGTLKMWQGLPVEQFDAIIEGKFESEFLKPGVVFTTAELKSVYKLSDAHIGLYREFRASTDMSLTNLALSDMLRVGGKDVADLTDMVMTIGDVEAASALVRDRLLEMAEIQPDRNDVLTKTANTIIKNADKVLDLQKRGYAPLSRFGSYSLDVVDAQGERVYFGLFESEAEANKMARQMQRNFPGAQIAQGTVSEEQFKLFAGVSPETLELFGGMLGLDSQGDEAPNRAFQDYLRLAKSNRSSMKRLIERKGIAGFSEDPGRVLAGFVYSNARQTSSGLHLGQVAESINDIPKGQGETKDAAMRLYEYVKNPQEEGQAIRGLLFAQYLGGSLASAMVNLTQPFAVSFPWLSQYGGAVKAAGQMRRAVADSLKKSTGEPTLDAALKRAEDTGIVSPQEVFQLMQQAQGKATLKSGDGTRTGDALAIGSNAVSKLAIGWGKLFGVAEQFNRRTTFIAAYRTAIEQGIKDPAGFAEKAVTETQFVYNKGAKPRWARGVVGGTLFTFKSYSINYLELLSRMANNGPEGRKAALLAMAMLFLLSGAGGMPFADDLDDLLDGLMQRLGYNFNSKQAKSEFFAGILGEDGARFVERGISGLAGVPIDVAGRLGMGNLLPGTGLFTKKKDYTSDVVELLGPAGDLAKRAFQAANKTLQGNVLGADGALATIAPKAAANMIKGVDMFESGIYKDNSGKKVIDVDGTDAFSKFIGFQPNDVAQVQNATRRVQVMIEQNKMREAEIADMWAKGLFEKDAAMVQEAKADLAQWNLDNPNAPIRIQISQIFKRLKAMNQTKVERMLKTTPKEIRSQVREELAGLK